MGLSQRQHIKQRSKLVKNANMVSIEKSLIGAIPYIGDALNEVLFERRSRIKQERLNNFIIGLSQFLSKYSESEINYDYINTEVFSDIFESIIKRVINSNSTSKINRFKNVLIQQLIQPQDFNYTENFLDLIEKLNDYQVLILIGHSKFNYDLNDVEERMQASKLAKEDNSKRIQQEERLHTKGKANDYNKIMSLIRGNNDNIENLEKLKLENIHLRKPEHYNLSIGEYCFCVQDLISKGLLIDAGITWNKTPLQFLSITEFGRRFLKFINEYNHI